MSIDVRLIIGSAAVVGTAIGAAAGYLVAKNQLQASYETRLEEEVARTKQQYQMRAKVGEYAEPELITSKYPDGNPDALEEPDPEDVEVLREAVKKLSYTAYSKTEPQEEVVVSRVEFGVSDDDFDYDEEKEKRRDGGPYVISFEEFNDEHTEFAKVSLMYFDEDDTLVDDQEIPIQDVEHVLGGESLERFGHGSKDARVVYVRNLDTSTDYEVTKQDGSFEEFCMGGTVEHGDKVRKFRGGYE